jgi:hypothetical protein
MVSNRLIIESNDVAVSDDDAVGVVFELVLPALKFASALSKIFK